MTMDQEARALVAQLVAALPAPTALPLDQQREEDARADTAMPHHSRSIPLGAIRKAGAAVAAANAALAALAATPAA